MWWCLVFLCAACGRLGFDAVHVNAIDAADAAPDATVTNDDPIGYWPFDEGGGIIALDVSGHGGMLTQMVSRIAGHRGGAVSFNGADDEEVDLAMPAPCRSRHGSTRRHFISVVAPTTSSSVAIERRPAGR